MKITPLKRYVAGIDPGTQTGIGVYDRNESRIVFITTTDFFGVIPWLMRMVRISELKVFVELPSRFIYDRHQGFDQKIRDNVLHKAGGNRREAELLAEMLKREGFDVETVSPTRQKKWQQYEFERMAKCNRKTNQHERDGARLAIINANRRGA